MSATDPDTGNTVTYSITAGNSAGKFSIGSSSGAITVAAALDYETVTSYSLTVEASDGNGGTDTATVNITVTDVNEAPVFGSTSSTLSVSEAAAIGASVGTVSATDPDTGNTVTYSITAGNSAGKFSIGSSSGAITVAAALDYETDSSYTLTVEASDGNGGTDTATVNITVTDVNEAPVFGSTTYTFSVSEAAAIGTSVGTVSATDPDSGNTVTYSITAGNSAGKFSIGSSSGAITVAASLDYETVSSYSLTVEASDGNGGTDTATVNISVDNVNEISISSPADPVREGNDMIFTLDADFAVTGDVTVTYTFDNSSTATYAVDYTFDFEDPSNPWTVTIASGDSSAQITINSTAGGGGEAYETVILTITAVNGVDVAIGDSTDTGEIADQVAAGPVNDNESLPAIDIDHDDEPSTKFEFKIKTDCCTGLVDLRDYDRRAYVIKVQAKPVGGGVDDWYPANVASANTGNGDVGGYTGSLPDYANLGYGQIVWVEGSDPPDYRYVLLEVGNPFSGTTSVLDVYRVTITKPDFAVIERPTLATTGATPPGTGHVTLTATIRNSSESGSAAVDDEGFVEAYCREEPGGASSYSDSARFDQLIPAGSSELLPSKTDKLVDIPVICIGGGFQSSDTIRANVRVETEQWKQPWVRGNNTISWPFDVNTLWHAQTTTAVTGGLQMLPPGGLCTVSFPLDMRPPGSSSMQTEAISTTGHCVESGQDWEQGSLPAGLAGNISLGTTWNAMLPADTTCYIFNSAGVAASFSNCRRGDHAYASGSSPAVSNYIFRPAVENSLNLTSGLSIQHFKKHSSVQFEIVGARPPDQADEVVKVGRTTGWATGDIKSFAPLGDPTCPGDKLGSTGHFVEGEPSTTADDYYIECLVQAAFPSDGGDSGSPVFVEFDYASTSNVVEVLLVGVLYGKRGTSNGAFIPIDRIYAESLLQGQDWLTDEMRPLPALNTDVEPLVLDSGGWAIVATFDGKDLSQQDTGLKYEAALYRTTGGTTQQVTKLDGLPYVLEITRTTDGGAPGRFAEFEVANIPLGQQNGVLTVRARMCVTDFSVTPSTTTCSDYGSDGGTSLHLPPAPQSVQVTDTGTDSADLSWQAVPDTTGYGFAFREVGTTDWIAVQDSVTSSPAQISPLGCNKDYQFIVRAYGDGTPYNLSWGFWSQPASGTTDPCPP